MHGVVRPALAAAALLIVVACGGSGSQTVTSPGAVSSGTPGTVTISSTVIQNQTGKVLVVLAAQEGQSGMVARACIQIASNSFTVSSTAMVEMAASGNPCDASSTTKAFSPGRYTLTAGIYTGGSQTPEKTTAQAFQVSGNVSVAVDGTALSGG